jgi:hypothetical protein
MHSAWVFATDGREIDTSKLIWHNRVLPASAEEVRRWAADGTKDEMAASPRNRAQEFLLRLLEDGPISANEAYALAEDEGITRKMLRGASEKLDVVSTRVSDDRGTWYEWSLPERRRHVEPLINLEHVEEGQAHDSGQAGHSGQPRHAGQVEDSGQVGRGQKVFEVGSRHSMSEMFDAFMRKSNGRS